MTPKIETFADFMMARADLLYAKRKEREAIDARYIVENRLNQTTREQWEAYLASRGLQVGDLVIATAEVDQYGERHDPEMRWGPYYILRVHSQGFDFGIPKADGSMGKREPSRWDKPPRFAMLTRYTKET